MRLQTSFFLLGVTTFLVPGIWQIYKQRWVRGLILLLGLLILGGLLISNAFDWNVLSVHATAILLIFLYAIHFVLLAGELTWLAKGLEKQVNAN